MTAKDLMSQTLVSVTPEMSIRELADILVKNRLNGVPVLDSDGRFLGVAGEHDLIHHEKPLHIPTTFSLLDAWFFIEPPGSLKKEIERIAATQVKDVFQKDPPTVSPSATVEEMAQIFEKTQADLLPVLEKGSLVGVIGRSDLLRALAQDEIA
ncbi:MAG: CBS domain-containing protein [Nitrospirae bacterium]|jgi:CBS domain-containing protein|nr:CBS domain-containing protein [Nitrospirota bacterium]